MEHEDLLFIPETGALINFGEIGLNELPLKSWIRNDEILGVSCGDDFIVFSTNFKNHEEEVVLIACGRCHTLIVTRSGSCYGFGSNSDAQLGIEPKFECTNVPMKIESLSGENVTKIAAGGDFSAAINDRGELLVWGSNSEGQLGLGTEDEDTAAYVWPPRRLELLSPSGSREVVRVLSCGCYHMGAVTSSGRLLMWGEGVDGQLGTGRCHNEPTPQKVELPSSARDISCGNNHSLCLSENGSVFVWGSGEAGQLGTGDFISSTIPISLTADHQFTGVYAGHDFSYLVTTRGLALSFGDGRYGRLGHSVDRCIRPRVVERMQHMWVDAVACGGCHVVLTVRQRSSTDRLDVIPGLTSQPLGTTSTRRRRRRPQTQKISDAELPQLTPAIPDAVNGILADTSGDQIFDVSHLDTFKQQNVAAVRTTPPTAASDSNLTEENGFENSRTDQKTLEENVDNETGMKKISRKRKKRRRLRMGITMLDDEMNGEIEDRRSPEDLGDSRSTSPAGPILEGPPTVSEAESVNPFNQIPQPSRHNSATEAASPHTPEISNVGCAGNCQRQIMPESGKPKKRVTISEEVSYVADTSSGPVSSHNTKESKTCQML